MKITLAALLCAAVVAATPHPWAAQASVSPSSRPHAKGNKTHKHTHKEPTPVFKEPCDCQKPIIPMNLLSANEVSGLWSMLGSERNEE
jgi:hypothetical protein